MKRLLLLILPLVALVAACVPPPPPPPLVTGGTLYWDTGLTIDNPYEQWPLTQINVAEPLQGHTCLMTLRVVNDAQPWDNTYILQTQLPGLQALNNRLEITGGESAPDQVTEISQRVVMGVNLHLSVYGWGADAAVTGSYGECS